jgi:hypothetical protein
MADAIHLEVGQDVQVTSPNPAPPKFTYDPLSAFPLLWRWTQSTHDVLSPEELANIRPLHADSARLACNHGKTLHDTAGGANADTFQLAIEHENEAELEQWLRRLVVAPDDRVIVSWDPRLAVETVWALFASRWSAFWYPSSDDVDVFSLSGAWLLRVTHHGRFAWAPVRRRPVD